MQNYKTWFVPVALTLLTLSYTNFAFAQPVVKVLAGKNSKAIKKQAEVYMDHLNVQENFYLLIKLSPEMPRKLEGITILRYSPETDVYQFQVIVDANLSENQQMLVLAHEIVHVKQYAKKELIILNNKKVVWRGKKHHYSGAYNRQMPWEIEAYKFDRKLVNLFKSKKINNEETLADQCI
jgi:hypothetical protein